MSARHKRLRDGPRACRPPAGSQEYRANWLPGDIVAGVTLAAYAIPVSLAYAGLAGLPPQVGVYGYLLGGLGYALLGSSRQLAVGPTSAISLMIAGTVGAMAGGDVQRYAQIASLAGFTVAALCLLAWLLRLSALVKLISDSILVGFKAGAGLTIAMTQLPSLLGVAGGGHNFFERALLFVGQLGQTRLPRARGWRRRDRAARARRAPAAGTGRSRLAVVALSILAASLLGLPALGVPITGEIPAGLPDARRARRCGCATSRASFRSPPDACCSPISRASPPPAPLRQSTAMRSTRARSFSASARPISRRRSGRAIRSRAGCRNRR